MADKNTDLTNAKEKDAKEHLQVKYDLITDEKKKSGLSTKQAVIVGMMALLLLILFGGTLSLLQQGHILLNSSTIIVDELVPNITEDIQGDPLTPPVKYISLEGSLDSISATRREKIREMMQHAWNKYKLFAWGQNELRPRSMRGNSRSIFGNTMMGATIVGALDTLYIMGLKEEFEEGQKWIVENLDTTIKNLNTDLPVYQTNVHFIGGLLSCFALTGDVTFVNTAAHLAQKLLPAFRTKTGIPKALVNAKYKYIKNYGWASGGRSILAEVGGLHLEFSYLSDVTSNPVFHEKVANVRSILKSKNRPQGLYSNFISPDNGEWGMNATSIGSQGDAFYEYLLKSWLQSGRKDQEGRLMFDDAMHYIIKLLYKKSPSGLSFIGDYKYSIIQPTMDHSACSVGALLGLAAETLKNNMSSLYMEIAENITNSCHESYVRTLNQLGPNIFFFSEGHVKATWMESYELWPEVLESYLILWRLTKNEKYREWGWEVVQAIESHCRLANGYAGIRSVYAAAPMDDDIQHSYFLSATLKYLYLLFSDDNLLSLDEWVFNSEGHPLPIKAANPLYRERA